MAEATIADVMCFGSFLAGTASPGAGDGWCLFVFGELATGEARFDKQVELRVS